MRRKALVLIVILSFLSGQAVTLSRAADSTPQSIVVYTAAILGGVEAINLLVRGIIYLVKKKPVIKVIPPVQTNRPPPVTNVIAAAVTNHIVALVMSNTNKPLPVIVPAPLLVSPRDGFSTTNRILTLSWSLHMTNTPVAFRIITDLETNISEGAWMIKTFAPGIHTWRVQAVLQRTNPGPWSEDRHVQIISNVPRYTSTTLFSNLSESEKDDIQMFGADYYYLVSLAYYGVKKKEKSREFMFHSLAIGVRVVEGTQFLKETMRLSDKDIAAGVARYRRSR